MLELTILFAVVPGVILFLYGVEHFSREMMKVAGERFQSMLTRITASPVQGAFLGAFITAIIQSSTATTTITVGLVNSGIIPFVHSLGIIFGSNLGTAVTAQLVAFRVTSFGPIFIILGFVLSLIGGRYKFMGKPLFYFGLVFFSLNLISTELAPLRENTELISALSAFDNVIIGIIAGFLFTVMVQSSSVTAGIVVLFAASGLIGLGQGIPLILGSNIGTTATALLASWKMNLFARRTAVSHLLFNVIGILLILPFLGPFEQLITAIGGTHAHMIANAHLIFNLTMLMVFLLVINRFEKLVVRLVPGTEKEILFQTEYLKDGLPEDNKIAFYLIEKEIANSMNITIDLYKTAMSAMRSIDDAAMQRVVKLESLNDFLDKKISEALVELSKRDLKEHEAERITMLVRISNVIERLGDNARKIASSFETMHASSLHISQDGKDEINAVYERFNANFIELGEVFPDKADTVFVKKMRRYNTLLEKAVLKGYQKHIHRAKSGKAYSGSVFVSVVSTLDSANGKLEEVVLLSRDYGKIKAKNSK